MVLAINPINTRIMIRRSVDNSMLVSMASSIVQMDLSVNIIKILLLKNHLQAQRISVKTW